MNKQEIIDILSDNTKNDWLFKEADRVRQKNVGDEVHLRGLVEFSNICKCQCKYCGLRSPKMIITTLTECAKLSVKLKNLMLR